MGVRIWGGFFNSTRTLIWHANEIPSGKLGKLRDCYDKYGWFIVGLPIPVVPHKAVAEVSKIGNL